MNFPLYRPRRLRKNELFRSLVRETHLRKTDLICPLFVKEGIVDRASIASMPGQYQFSLESLVQQAKEIRRSGVLAVLLFGIPSEKDEYGSQAYADNGIVQTAIRKLKQGVPDLAVISDVCLCEYTSHGHCGVIQGLDVDNDKTLGLLARMALSHARAGVDMVAPSDMMDGRVAAIRKELDENGFSHVPILSYAAKYASNFYGPFREAAESAPQFGDRRSYQMDSANVLEAIREVRLDVEEGADIVMVKPALPYLDVISRVRSAFDLPVAAYQVSGEYAMIKAAAQMGWINEQQIMMECLLSIKRAGADLIITYFAQQAVLLLGD